MTDSTCRDCKHWHKIVMDGQQSVAIAGANGGMIEIPRIAAAPKQPVVGQCRERLHVAIQMGQGRIGTISVYPQTAEDWPKCGQFVERGDG